MATQVDPLRSTLDHLALDPRARSDRPYLLTMLRRLGYSEAEIAMYLGEQPEAAPPPPPVRQEAPPRREPAPPESGERVIEIEYTGPGLRPFQLVVPMSEEEASIYDPLGLGAGLEAGSMTIEGDPDEDELSSFLEGEGAISFDDEFAGDEDEFEAEADRDNEEIAVKDEDDGFLSLEEDQEREQVGPGSPSHDDEAFGEGLDELEGTEGFGPEADAQEPGFQKGRKLVTFSSVPLKDASVRRLQSEPASLPETPSTQETSATTPALPHASPDDEDREALGWDTDDSDAWNPEGGWDAVEPAQDEALSHADAGAGRDEGYWHNDWLLHSREEDDEEGNRQRMYFFAKGRSPNGTPAAMPEGYGVATNPETGLPYLQPAGPAGAEGRKRIRMRRVKASSQQEAEEALRSEGRNVLGSMPVDVKQHEEDEP